MRVTGLPYVQGAAGKASNVAKTGIAIHATANPGANAEAEAAYAARRTDGIGAHLFFDNNSGVQSCDTVQRVGHAGSSEGNYQAVAVEITGANAWTRQQWIDRVDWPLLGGSLAQVCRAHGIPARWLSVAQMKADPRARGFYTHNDMRLAWGGTDHTDPGPNFPRDVLMSAVVGALNGGTDMTDFTSADPNAWTQARRVEALINNAPVIDDAVTNPEPNKLAEALARLQTTLDTVVQLLGTLGGPGGAPLSDADVQRIARAVADEDHRRSAD